MIDIEFRVNTYLDHLRLSSTLKATIALHLAIGRYIIVYTFLAPALNSNELSARLRGHIYWQTMTHNELIAIYSSLVAKWRT